MKKKLLLLFSVFGLWNVIAHILKGFFITTIKEPAVGEVVIASYVFGMLLTVLVICILLLVAMLIYWIITGRLLLDDYFWL